MVALGFIALAVVNALFSPQLSDHRQPFVTMVCLVMALMFAANPLLYLKSEGKLPIPFRSDWRDARPPGNSAQPIAAAA